MNNLSATEEDVKIIYEAVLQDGRKCMECEFNYTFSEYEPWGNTVAERKLRECMVPDPVECPGVRREIKV